MRAAKKDANHAEIATIFRAHGFDVLDTSAFSGKMLDLLVTLGDRYFQFIEIKDGKGKKLTENEVAFINKRPKVCMIIYSADQAARFCAYVIAEEKF
jgi:Holliday junction resolvase